MSDTPEIETDYTDNPVCPHCGYEADNAWAVELEMCDGECTECECGICGESFEVTAHVSISYTTKKLAADTGDKEAPK